MTQEEKQLVLTDICARLPYGVKAQVCGWDEEKGEVEVPLKVYSINTDGYLSFEYNHYSVETVYVEDCRLYLRPMSSMTEEEKKELKNLFDAEEVTSDSICYLEGGTLVEYLSHISYSFCSKIIDWLNKHHFDYRGLIPKGLALEAPEGMYN